MNWMIYCLGGIDFYELNVAIEDYRIISIIIIVKKLGRRILRIGLTRLTLNLISIIFWQSFNHFSLFRLSVELYYEIIRVFLRLRIQSSYFGRI